MTYPQGPSGSSGYPPAQQPTTQFAAPTQQFGKVPDTGPAAAEGPSKLPMYLTAAVAALGLAVYLSSFGPLFTAGGDFFTPILLDVGVVAAILAGLIAGVGLLPKQKAATATVAVLSVLSFLLVILVVLTVPDGVAMDWGLYLIIAFTVLQAIVAVSALLFDAGVITAPAPRPRYEQQQYGQYGAPGQYYGQPQGQPQHHGGPQPQQGPQHRQGYPSQYGGGYPGGGPSTGGYPGGAQSGPPTPPTGFPTFGQPPASSPPTTQVQSQPQSSSSSSQSPTTPS
jgi:Family of unknown function (DUF5336)